MISSSPNIIVRVKYLVGVCERTDKGQRRNMRFLPRKRGTQVITQPKVADSDRLRIGIVDFEPIVARKRIGHPLINFEICGVSERRKCIGDSSRWNVEHPIAAP